MEIRMKQNFYKITRTLPLILIMLLCLVLPQNVQAKTYQDSDPEDYITEQFDVEIVADEAHSLHVTETIKVDFVQSHHGIYRNIPDGKKVYSVDNVQVKGYKFEVSKEDGDVAVKIGDADTYLNGKQTFVLSYDLNYYKDDSTDADYLAQNLLPTDWETSIRESVMTLTMPKAVDWEEMEYYAGPAGSTAGLDSRYVVRETAGNAEKLLIWGSDLPKGYGVTVRGSLEEGYWAKAQTFIETHKSLLMMFGGVFGVPALIMIILFFIFGKDPKLIKTVEFRPPDGITPLEAGYLVDGDAEDSDCMSMILYFASKGYLAIRETSKEHYKLTKVKEIDPSEADFSQTLFKGLFKNKDEVSVGKIRQGFADDISTAKSQVEKKYNSGDNQVFRPGCRIARFIGGAFLIIFAIISAVAFDSAFRWFPIIMLIVMGVGIVSLMSSFDHRLSNVKVKMVLTGVVITGVSIAMIAYSAGRTLTTTFGIFTAIAMVIILVLTMLMRARTKQNMQMMGRLLGFRDFLKKAEYDRLKRLVDEDPEYFYEILPYAEVMGLRTAWAEKFTELAPQEPSWYTSYHRGPYVYSILWCDHLMDRCVVNGAPQKSSSGGGSGGGYSGGFSGGGFSGGGGGGGGGGAW